SRVISSRPRLLVIPDPPAVFYARHVNGDEYERNAQRRNWVDLPADGMVRGAWFDTLTMRKVV
ncbi:hypothetical protein KC220_25200, partial [Mycobacterium tuberculosis]|nr:hypothetical protein [Mycobacterium tuberculosis]